MGEAAQRSTQQRRAFALLAVPVLLFGTAWPVNKLALAGMPPLWFAAGRVAVGTLVSFLLLAALRQLRRPRRRDLPIIATVGLLQFALFFAFTNEALAYLPAGRSIVLSNTTTLWLVPMTLVTGEAIPPLRWVGVAAGLAGIVTLANPWSLDWHAPGVAIGHAYPLLAALAWACGIIHARRHRWTLSPLQLLPWEMLLAAAVLLPTALLLDPAPRIEPSAAVLAGFLYVAVLSGPLASWAAVVVARDLPTVVSSLGFLGIPAMGLLISTTLLGEQVTWSLGGGAALILAGVALAILARAPVSSPSAATSARPPR